MKSDCNAGMTWKAQGAAPELLAWRFNGSMHMQALYKQGVYTVVDMHQDFYSRWLNKGCGEGFPQ